MEKGKREGDIQKLKSLIIPTLFESSFKLILLSLLSELLRNNQSDIFKLHLLYFLSLASSWAANEP